MHYEKYKCLGCILQIFILCLSGGGLEEASLKLRYIHEQIILSVMITTLNNGIWIE